MYTPNNRAPKYTEQELTELKREINNLAIIGGDLNIHCIYGEIS